MLRSANPSFRAKAQSLCHGGISVGTIAAMRRAGQDPLAFIQRHRSGDWGDVCAGDAKANDEAVANEGDPERQERVLSSYVTSAGEKLWVITEADRSSTCILLPDEY